MPRFRIEESLFDPLVIELGGRVFTSVPRSVQLVETVQALDGRRKAKEISDTDFMIQFLGLMFDVNPQEFKVLDKAIIEAIADRALEYVHPATSKISPAADEKKIAEAIEEAKDPKNEKKPEQTPLT